MKPLNIIGASGQGKVAADIAYLVGYDIVSFFDDDVSKGSCAGIPIVGSTEDVQDAEGDLFVAVGNPRVREMLMKRFRDRRFPTLVHPSAAVAQSATIDEGSIVMAGAVINPEAIIGKGCIINTCASVDHDCTLNNYVHVAVGAHLCGTVKIGKATWIGAGSTVINNLSVCEDVVVGAGAVVVKTIEVPGTYVGVPARRIDE